MQMRIRDGQMSVSTEATHPAIRRDVFAIRTCVVKAQTGRGQAGLLTGLDPSAHDRPCEVHWHRGCVAQFMKGNLTHSRILAGSPWRIPQRVSPRETALPENGDSIKGISG